jgi:hypothetical protein
MREDEFIQLFERKLKDVQSFCGPLNICLAEAPDHMFPKKRAYAFFSEKASLLFDGSDDVSMIAFAGKFRTASRDRMEAIMMHEFGHAMDLLAPCCPLPLPDRRNDPTVHRHGSERRADALAEGLWGVHIKYDADTVQSLCCGVRPRPIALGL